MLKTNLMDKKLKSPLILGSGTLGESKEPIIKALESGAGAAVNRSLRVDNNRRQHFNNRYYFGESYMLNADNNNAKPWQYWVDCVEEIEKRGPLFIGLSARNPEDSKTIVSEFERKRPPSFYELNFSCPHSAKIYGAISYREVGLALDNIKDLTKTPVFLKMSLNNVDHSEIKSLENRELVDGYVLSNTIGPGMKIDIKARKPVLDSVFGGVSGPAIKPLVLAGIYDLKQQTELPIIGVGGIYSGEDALEYLMLGCEAVQVYTRAHRDGVGVFRTINCEMESILSEMGESVESIKGSADFEMVR